MNSGYRAMTVCLVAALLIGVLPALPAHAGAAPPPPISGPALDREIQLGRQGAQQIEQRFKLVADSAVNDRVTRMGAAIAAQSQRPNLPYSFKVVEIPQPNAVALPGGFIYVTTGLLGFVRSDHELAAVIAHEVAHAALGHGLEMQRRANRAMFITLLVAVFTRDPNLVGGASVMGGAMMSGYSRDLEREADLMSVDYLVRTPYSPVGVLTLLERLHRLEVLSGAGPRDGDGLADHPRTIERAQYVAEALRAKNIALNRRAPANYLALRVREGTENGAPYGEIFVNDRSILKLGDVSRIKEAADLLDRLFDADLDPFEITVQQSQGTWNVSARGWAIVRLSAGDVPPGVGSARDFAAVVAARIKAAIDDDVRRRRLTG
jgi:Zn-dependent protease with chaperone function